MRCIMAVSALCLAATSVLAHHALEYIEMESHNTARSGEAVFHLHYDYMVDDEDNADLDHWELTPGLSYGLHDRLMLDVHTHFAKFGIDHVVAERRAAFSTNGPPPFMEAVAATLQLRLTDGAPVGVAVAGTIEVPFDRAEDLLGSEDNVYEAMLILGRDFEGHQNVTLNLSYEVEGDEEAYTWALGAKTPISPDPHGIAAGVEVLGDFEHPADNWAVLPGVYMPLGSPNLMFKTGLEFGESEGLATRRANLSLLYRF